MTTGLSRAGFDLDLREGQAREDALAHVLLRSKVEVKSDKGCRRTGNLFIELRQKTQPSGFATTEADWWAFEYDDDRWLFLPRGVVDEAVQRAYREGRTAKGGDFNNYDGVLVPIAWFLPRGRT